MVDEHLRLPVVQARVESPGQLIWRHKGSHVAPLEAVARMYRMLVPNVSADTSLYTATRLFSLLVQARFLKTAKDPLDPVPEACVLELEDAQKFVGSSSPYFLVMEDVLPALDGPLASGGDSVVNGMGIEWTVCEVMRQLHKETQRLPTFSCRDLPPLREH